MEIFVKDLPKLRPYYVNGAISHTINVHIIHVFFRTKVPNLGALVGSMNLTKSRGLPPLQSLFLRRGWEGGGGLSITNPPKIFHFGG